MSLAASWPAPWLPRITRKLPLSSEAAHQPRVVEAGKFNGAEMVEGRDSVLVVGADRLLPVVAVVVGKPNVVGVEGMDRGWDKKACMFLSVEMTEGQVLPMIGSAVLMRREIEDWSWVRVEGLIVSSVFVLWVSALLTAAITAAVG